ncbi:MAG: DNA polymerase III subunit gamma/tau [Candidatus Binatales bacterium]
MAYEPTAHLVLARKWRPERFDDLVGQEHVTRTLVQALKTGRIAHAFLFAGIRGVGKTTAARIMARCLNCERGPTPDPCGECAACVEIRAGRALDTVEIDGATYRKIDDARAIIENLSYRPARDRFKIYIIDEAHQLTDQAFNALLKTLEEPPAHVKFILATTEPNKMPETILSRLQRYDFRRIPFKTIVARLTDLCAREKIEAEEGALRLLAREAGGSMRDAERMLETAIAVSGGRVAEAEVAATLGVASRTTVYATIEAILGKDAASALAKVRELHARGANLESLGRDLLEALRNLAIAKIPAAGADTPLSDLPDHEAAEIRRLADGAGSRDLMRLFRLMAETQEELLRSPYPDLIIEMAIVRMATLAPVIDADDLMRAIGAAEASPGPASRGVPPGGAPPGGEAPGARRLKVEGEVKAQAPRKAADGDQSRYDQPQPRSAQPRSASGSGSLGAGVAISSPEVAPASDLPDLRDYVRSRRAALAGFMEQGALLSLDGDILRVAPRSDIYLRYLKDNLGVLAELASAMYGRPIQASMGANGGGVSAPAAAGLANPPAPAGPETAAPPSREAAPAGASRPDAVARSEARQALYADPLVRRIFDELGARLVEVRDTPNAGAARAAPDPKKN